MNYSSLISHFKDLGFAGAQGFLTHLLKHSLEGVWVLDLEWKTIFANESLASMLGYRPEEMSGESCLNYVAQPYRALARSRLEKRRMGEAERHTIQLQKKDGSLFWVLISSDPIRDQAGAITGIIAFVADISQLKEAEAKRAELSEKLEQKVQERTRALQETYDQLRSQTNEKHRIASELNASQTTWEGFFNAAPMAMGIVELRDDQIYHVADNPVTCRIFGVPDWSTRGKSTRELGTSREQEKMWIDRYRECLQLKRPVSWETENETGGNPIWFSTVTSFIGLSPEGYPRFCHISQDITDKKLEGIRMAQLSKMSALGEMASAIAHEINNPLTIIQGNADLLLRDLRRPTGSKVSAEEIASEIRGVCQRIREIINGLKFFAREGSGDPKESVPISDLVEQTLTLCAERFRDAQIEVLIEAQFPEPAVLCRPVQISQVLLNLFNNAFDAIHASPRSRDRWVKIKTRKEGEFGIVEVFNGGEPIPEKVRDRIFEPFFTTKPPGSGTGLGLSICRGILAEHSGSIELMEAATGTGLRVTLPCV